MTSSKQKQKQKILWSQNNRYAHKYLKAEHFSYELHLCLTLIIGSDTVRDLRIPDMRLRVRKESKICICICPTSLL